MRSIFAILVLLLMVTAVVHAQDTPEAVLEAAIADLNQQIPGIGRPNSWRHYNPGSANESSMGCPLVEGEPLDFAVIVYQVWLNYGGVEYLYYVSSDGALVVPCDSKIPTPQTTNCTVTLDEAVNVYQLPVRSSTLLGTTATLFPGQNTLNISGRNADSSWYMLYVNQSQRGWIGVTDVAGVQGDCSQLPNTDTGDATPDDTTCILTATQANVRANPTTTAQVVGSVVAGQRPIVIGRTADNSWYQILDGWVAATVSSVSGTGCATLPITGAAAIDYGSCPSNFYGYLRPRLAVDTSGKVEEGGVPNRVRANPTISAEILFQLQPGDRFTIIDGPQCGNGIVWWYIEQNGQYGWTAESDADQGEYYLAPIETADVSAADYPCPANFAGYVTPRVQRTDPTASVVPTYNLNMFAMPSTSSTLLTSIPGGTSFGMILDGPACNEGIVWWRVTLGERDGWVPESDVQQQQYFIEPYQGGATTGSGTGSGSGTAPETTPTGAITAQTVASIARMQSLNFEAGSYTDIAWAPDSSKLALISADGVELHSYPTLQPDMVLDPVLQNPGDDAATALAFHPNGQYLVIGYQSGAIMIVELGATRTQMLNVGHNDVISSLSFDAQGTRMLSSSGYVYASFPETFDFSVKVWNFSTFQMGSGAMDSIFQYQVPANEASPVLDAAFTPDGDVALITPSDVRVLGVGGVTHQMQRFATAGAAIQGANVTWYNSGSVVLYTNGSAILALDTTTGTINRDIASSPPGTMLAFDQAPGNQALLAAYVEFPQAENMIGFYDPTTNAGIHAVRGVNNVTDLAFSPNGNALAVITGNMLEIWGIQ